MSRTRTDQQLSSSSTPLTKNPKTYSCIFYCILCQQLALNASHWAFKAPPGLQFSQKRKRWDIETFFSLLYKQTSVRHFHISNAPLEKHAYVLCHGVISFPVGLRWRCFLCWGVLHFLRNNPLRFTPTPLSNHAALCLQDPTVVLLFFFVVVLLVLLSHKSLQTDLVFYFFNSFSSQTHVNNANGESDVAVIALSPGFQSTHARQHHHPAV